MRRPPDSEAGALLLLLLDSRSPSGGHNHSMGMEAAIGAGLLRDLADLEASCRGRLRTSGRVAGAFAAAACRVARDRSALACLDDEFAARTPSEAMRTASEQLANGLRRLVRAMLPPDDPTGLDPTGLDPTGPELSARYHPVLLGAVVAVAGGSAVTAARAAALTTVSVPAGAAVRLLGFDPFAVQAMLARLAREIDGEPEPADVEPAALPCDTAPALDLLADHHLTTEVRLFAS
jgi:urease accessory protein